MAEKSVERRVTIAGKPFTLRPRDVVNAVRKLDPEPIAEHYVVVAQRRFPPKQVIGAVTGLDRADFTTHQARRTLTRLGFAAGRRRSSSARTSGAGAAPGSSQPLLERLRPWAGQWVAVKDDDLLHAAASMKQLVGWLSRHDQRADSVFRVPEDAVTSSGLAPL